MRLYIFPILHFFMKTFWYKPVRIHNILFTNIVFTKTRCTTHAFSSRFSQNVIVMQSWASDISLRASPWLPPSPRMLYFYISSKITEILTHILVSKCIPGRKKSPSGFVLLDSNSTQNVSLLLSVGLPFLLPLQDTLFYYNCMPGKKSPLLHMCPRWHQLIYWGSKTWVFLDQKHGRLHV